jgi:type I restriction enzyme S subunit
MKNLSVRDALARVRVPLPPLPEQRRIAEILDKADALRAKRRAALAQLDTLTQSIFLDMFGDPATNPKGWPVVSIADICEVKGGKRLPKGEEYSSVPTPFRYIRVVDLKGGRVDEAALVYLKPEIQAEIARYVVNTGDVIISIAGSIGLVAPVPQSLNGVNLTENAAKLVPRSAGRYEAQYLARFLETDHAQGQIGSHIGQVTIGKLALFRIEKLQVPLPPIELQREFVRRAAEVDKHGAAQKESVSRLDELFSSLRHRAFRGEL